MNKDSRYAVLAIAVLFAATGVTAGLVYFSNQKIEASTNGSALVQASRAIPLQTGLNYFTNGSWKVTKDSEIIGINGSLMNIKEAQARGIIGNVTSEDTKSVLGVNVSSLPANSKFVVEAKDISLSPAVYIQESGQ